MSVGDSSGLVKRCECLEFCASEWKTALYVGDRNHHPGFKDVFCSLTWEASLTPLSNQRSSLSSTRPWLPSKECPRPDQLSVKTRSCNMHRLILQIPVDPRIGFSIFRPILSQRPIIPLLLIGNQ